MKNILRSLSLLLALPLLMAASPQVVPSVAALRAGNFVSYPTVTLSAWYAGETVGGGTLAYISTDTTTADDGCMTFVDAASHRFRRVLNGTSLTTFMCGVKADGSTDNSVRLQAGLTAVGAYNLGELYCPAASGSVKFGTTLVPLAGSTFRGQANTYNPYLGSSSNAPGACHLIFTGTTGWSIDYQSPFTSGACPNGLAPKFYNFTLEQASTANGIRLNNSATAGFTDDCAAHGGGQSQLFGAVFDNLVLTSSQRSTTGIQMSKAFDATISNSVFSFFDTQVQLVGSDNILQVNNKYNFATLRAVDIQASGTFGNFNSIRDNTFFSVYTNATDFIRSSARSGVIDGNYFESDFTGITNVLNLTCGLAQSVTNNTMALAPANVAYWLAVTGDCTQITLTNNFPLGGGSVPSRWNAGAGSHWFANSTKQKIFAWGNPDDNSQTPFVTREPVPAMPNSPNAYVGAVLGVFDASTTANLGGNYASSINIGPVGFPGAFDFPAIAAAGGHVTFKFIPRVAGTVDMFIYANTASSTTQQITCTDGVTTTTMTMAGGTTKTWYTFSAGGGDVVNDPTIDCYNNDTGHGQHVYVYKWAAMYH